MDHIFRTLWSISPYVSVSDFNIKISTMAYQPPRPPLSPWAERFGPSKNAYWLTRPDNLRHSELAPRFPNLDPVSYSNFSAFSKDQVQKIAMPSNTELDDLFFGERSQQLLFLGMRTRQAGVLNDSVFPNKEGGHARWHKKENKPSMQYSIPDPLDTDRIVPNESQWFDCFKKYRWLVPEDQAPQTAELTDWSVDNDVVWKNLSISLELVNRILSRLMADQNRW
jgi:hypothetical protein